MGIVGYFIHSSTEIAVRTEMAEMHDIWVTAGDTDKAFEQGYQAGMAEVEAEKSNAVVLAKAVDGNTQVDIESYLGSCSDDFNSICVDDFESVKVCVLEADNTACGVYGNNEAWAQEDIILPARM